VPGVQTVRANSLTHNVLVHFDRHAVSPQAILAALRSTVASRERQRPEAVSSSRPLSGVPLLLRAGVRGLVGHAVVDALWFGAGFLGQSAGLPLAGALGPVHVLLDVAVWGMALSGK
jgi:hypothetical protein